MHLIEHAILSTDLAIYFQKKNRFITMVEKGEFNWQEEDQKACKFAIVVAYYFRWRMFPFSLYAGSVVRHDDDIVWC